MFERDTGCPGSQSNGYPQDPVKQDRGHPRVLPGLTIGQPASSSKPKHPDPQSQSLSRSYGSNLPTSLTYIILSTRGYSPRRPAADMGTSLCDSAVTLSLIFKVPPVTHGHSKNCCALCQTKTHSLLEGIPGPRRLMQKRQLFPELGRTSQAHFTLPCRYEGPDRFRYKVEE